MATGWKVRGSNPGGSRLSATIQTGPGAHPAPCKMGTGSYSGVKSGRSVTLNPHPLLVPWSRKSRVIPLLPILAVRPVQSLSACTTVHFTFTYTTTPLWAVRPVQSLSAFTRVHFTFTYTSTPPMSRTACTEPQCLYNGAIYLFFLTFRNPGTQDHIPVARGLCCSAMLLSIYW